MANPFASVARELCRFWCERDGAPRPVTDPVFKAVTEGRFDMVRGYSSCGDLPHCLLFALGVREEYINRKEHDGWHWGEEPGRRWDNNITTLVAKGKGTWGVNGYAQQFPKATQLLSGDILVVDCDYPRRTQVPGGIFRGPTHAIVLLDIVVGGVAVTAEYGQPGAAVRIRKLKVDDEDRVWLDHRRVDSRLGLEEATHGARLQGKLAPCEGLDGWLARKGLTLAS